MRFKNRKKLATIMTLASVLGSKSSAMNTSKNMGVAANNNSESSFNNQSKLDTENNITNRKIINSKNPDNISKKLSNRAMYGILATGGAGAAGLGALIYHVAELLFGNRNKKSDFFDEAVPDEEFTRYLKEKSVTSITLDNMGMLSFYSSGKSIKIINPINTAKLENPNVKNNELVDSAATFASYWFPNYYYYQLYLSRNIASIALRHGLILAGICDPDVEDTAEKIKGYNKREIILNVEYKDKKLLVKIFDCGSIRDITQEYNKDNPKTDLDKRKKEFYDELVKFINNDDFIKKLFLE